MSVQNINGGYNADRTKLQNQNNSDRTLFTKEKFTNSIMTALNKSNLNNTQKTQFSQLANNAFNQIDADQNQKISQKEANNGGAAILASFYEQVNNAINGINTDTTSNANKISDVATTSASQTTGTTQTTNNSGHTGKALFINDFSNANLAKQKSMIQQILPKDCEIVSYDSDGTLVVKYPDDEKPYTTNFYDELGMERPQPNTVDGIRDINAPLATNNINNISAADRANMTVDNNDIQAFIDAGYSVLSQDTDDAGNITLKVKNSDNQVGTITFNKFNGSVKFDEGKIGEQAFNAAQNQEIETAMTNNTIQFIQTNNIQNPNIDFKNIDVQNHCIHGTGTQNGKEVKFQIDIETGEVSMQEDKSTKFDYESFFQNNN